MDGDAPYCYRCQQTYGCICETERFASADTVIKELRARLGPAMKRVEWYELLLLDDRNPHRDRDIVEAARRTWPL